MEDKLATVILIAEQNDDLDILQVVKNIFSQTHKNIDLIVSMFKDPSDQLKKDCSSLSMNIRWVSQEPTNEFFNELLAMADGEIVFYKTLNNILWYPRHIEAHLEEFDKSRGAKWALSHVEYRNIDLGNHPYNALSFRIDNPPHPEKVAIDEICHFSDLPTDWSLCVRTDDSGNPLFYAGYVTAQWIESRVRGCIPPEMTIINWVKPEVNQGAQAPEDEENIKSQLQVPQATEIKDNTTMVDGEIVIERLFPTIVGNDTHKEYNDSVLGAISALDPNEVSSIALKRTIGMGDVIVAEPIIKKLRQKYPKAKIVLYTAKPSIVRYFENKPDDTVKLEQNDVIQDVLFDKPEQLKFDLDLAYESRNMTSFIDSYAAVCGIEFDNDEDKHVQLSRANVAPVERDKKVAVVCADGSGWPGKSWPIEKYAEVIKHLQKMGYYVIETGTEHTDLTPPQYHACSFDMLIRCISSAELYIGGDNGPMHIARGYHVPCVTIAGAALPYYTNPNKENIYYVENPSSPGYGIKHRFFLGKNAKGISFVPNCEEDPSCGLAMIEPSHVIEGVKKLNTDGFKLNVNGAMVLRDIIGGLSYYETNDGLISRDIPNYHPQQRINLAQYYSADTNKYFMEYLSGVSEIVKAKVPTPAKVLDVGCNMGILVKGLCDIGFDAEGVDININAVKEGQEKYKDIANKLNVKNATDSDLSFDYEFDVITCLDTLGQVGNPNKLLQNCKRLLKDKGLFIVTIPNVDKLDHKWEKAGFGENSYFFTKEYAKTMLESNGFRVIDITDSDNDMTTITMES
jgi:SAM-dependent methyltransferase